jgi:hypothetical protein
MQKQTIARPNAGIGLGRSFGKTRGPQLRARELGPTSWVFLAGSGGPGDVIKIH